MDGAAAPSVAAQPTATRPDSTRFVVQVRAYPSQGPAVALVARLEANGWVAAVSTSGTDQEMIYRVRVGEYASYASARKASTQLEALLGTDTWIALAEPSGLAGSPAPAADETTELWAQLTEALELLRTLDEHDGPVVELRLGSGSCGLPSAALADEESFSAQAASFARRPGLDLEAGVRTDIGDQQIEDGLPGSYLGLSMDLFQSGLFENRKIGEMFRLRAEEASVRAEIGEIDQENRCRVDATDASTVSLRRTVLEAKSNVMANLAVAYRQAYLSGAVYLDEVLASEQEVARTTTELEALPASATAPAGETPVGFPAVVQLDLDEILRRIEADENTERLLALGEQRARLSRDTDDATRLRAFVRYGFRPDAAAQDRVSAGLIFRMPLFEPKNVGLAAELEAARRRTTTLEADRATAAREAHRRFSDQVIRAVRQHYLYLERFERVRRSSADWSVDPNASDLRVALGRLTDLYNSALDRAASLRELHKAGAEVFVAARQPYDPELFRAMALPGPDYRGREGSRALYVWSSAFSRLDNGYLMELLRAKGFERVVLSASRSADPGKMTEFIATAQEAGLAIELALSTNAWLNPQRRDGITQRVATLELHGAGLHLDIEPQALEAFDDNPEALLEAYIDVVTRARAAAGAAVPLSISVPISWPADIYRRLDEVADRFYLMAYGQTNPVALAERLDAPLTAIDRKKLVLVLRPSDFQSEWEMDAVYTAISDATGIRSGAVHDVTGYLTLIETQR